MFYSLSFCKDQSACQIYLQGFTFSYEHFHGQVPPGKSHAGGPEILSSSKLTCCFSNAVVSTAESEKPKKVLRFLSCSLVPFSWLRAWEQCWSLILRQSMYFVQLQDLNTIMLAWLFFCCFVLSSFLNLINSGHFLNFKLILSCLPGLMSWNGHLTPLSGHLCKELDSLKASEIPASEGMKCTDISVGLWAARAGCDLDLCIWTHESAGLRLLFCIC